MDTFALALEKAAKIIEDGRLDAFVSERYASFHSGIGEKIVNGVVGMPELEAYALQREPDLPGSGRQEMLEAMVNRILF